MMTDPISDLLARIRNAQMVRHLTVAAPASKMRKRVLDVLKSEGYILGYEEKVLRGNIHSLEIGLKYVNGSPVIQEIIKISKPGRRIYSKVDNIKPIRSGLGISILSTSRGVMSDTEARRRNIGGEIICTVF